MAKANYMPLFLLAGGLIVLVLFGGTILTVGTALLSDGLNSLSNFIASFFAQVGGGLSPTPTPNPSSTPNPSVPTNPTPTVPPVNIGSPANVQVQAAGFGLIRYFDLTSGESGYVAGEGQFSIFHFGTYTISSKVGNQIKVERAYPSQPFDHWQLSPDMAVSSDDSFTFTVKGDCTVTGFFS